MTNQFKSRSYLDKQLKEFAQEFYHIRRDLKMTLDDAASASKLPRSAIEKIELGIKDIRHSEFFSLCKAYHKKIHIALVD